MIRILFAALASLVVAAFGQVAPTPAFPTSPPMTRALVAPTPPGACPEIPPEGSYSICGAGSCINMPDAIILFPGPAISCSDLQDEGFSGQLPLYYCSVDPIFIGDCECRPLAPSPPTPPPTPRPTTPPGPCLEIPPEGGCSICGNGSCVTMPDAIFEIPGQPDVIPCGRLQDAGFSGLIPLDICSSIRCEPEIGVCECRAFGPTLAPSTPTTSAPRPPGAPIDPIGPIFAPSSPTPGSPGPPGPKTVAPSGAPIGPSFAPLCSAPGAPGPKTIAPSAYGKTPAPAPALPTTDKKSKKDGKKKMSKIRQP